MYTQLLNSDAPTIALLTRRVERLLSRAYTRHLLVEAKNHRVVVCEPILFPAPLRAVLTEALLHGQHAHSVVYIPEPLLACVGAGVRNALVVDLGWHYCTVTPVFDLRLVHEGLHCTNRAGLTLHYALADQMASVEAEPPSFDAVEAAVAALRCPSMEESITSSELQQCLLKVLFPSTPTDNDDRGVVECVVRAVAKAPRDIRLSLLTLVVFTGGLAALEGLPDRILASVRLTHPSVKAYQCLGPWAGASLYASYESKVHPSMELLRDRYLEAPLRPYPDWLEQLHLGESPY